MTPQNKPQNLNFLFSPTQAMIDRATNGNQGQTMMDFYTSKMTNHPK